MSSEGPTTLADLDEFGGQAELLKPYVPRFLIEWLRESPQTTYRTVEGSLAFVDISGFTALTEHLARRGKIGAEVLRDTLDGVFRALLDEAYDWGAGLLKWGGDALLLLYDGDGHEARAARAAWEMQRTLERVGRLGAAGGGVTLRMSIGIATGELEFFTAGSVHRELLLVGPVATETVTIEARANAGEIGLSATLARRLDPRCVSAANAEALLVAPPEAERGGAPSVGPVRGADVAGCIPIAARAHVLLARSEPEHRTITVAFVDLMDTDLLLARLGPGAFAEALDERISAIQEAALRYEVPFNGSDVSKGSVKVILTAGAPSGTGHDEEQMLRALREVIERPGVIPLRAGVNTGRVFTGDFGPPYRRTYVVLGDAINTAARVMGRAEAGQILSTEIVLERSRALFATTPIEPFQAKGKAELVRASVVGALAGRRVERAAETPLVGRDGELAALREVRDRVTAGEGWIVELSGVSGIGKSRLVAELVATSPDVTFLHALCEEYEASTPYFALRAPLRAALGLDLSASGGEVEARLRAVVAGADAELVPWLPLLGILLGLDLPPTPETSGLDERFLSDTLADVVARFFASALADTPLVVVVDDAQFLDEASADLLRRLSSAAASPRHALVVVHSDPSTAWTRVEDEGVPFVALTLLPLAERHALEIAELVTDENPLLPHELEEIARRSGGSPLFLLELLDLARSTGTTESLPDSVEAIIAAEIDRLRPSDRTVLRYASVLGLRFEQELLSAAVRDEVEVDEALWVRLRGLVDPDPTGGLRFRNTLLRDVAYEGLAFRRRRELHGRVAEAIETGATAAEDEASPLALHFFAAQHYDKAWRYNRLAGDRARAVAANVEAGRFYETALAAGRRLRGIGNHDRASVWVALGAVREAAGLFDPSFTALRQATRLLLDDPVECARVFALRTKARVRQGAYGLALRETTAGLRVVEDVDSAAAVGARANLRAMRSEIRWLQGHPREAIALAEAAIAEAEPVQELEALARSYTALDGAYQMLGQPEKAVHERMSLDIYTRLGHTRSRGIMELNLGVQAYADGRWDEAASLYARAQEDCLRAGDRQHTAVAGANLGELLVSRGELDEAERLLTDARRVLRSSGFTPFALFAETQLARCALERDDVPAALQSLQRIVAEAAGVGHAGIVLEITLYFAQAQARAGHGAEGLEALNAAAFHAEEDAAFLAAPLERARAACLASLGRLDDARIFLDRALRSAEDQGLLYEQLLTRRALAELSAGESEEQLRETDRLAQLLGL